MKNYNTFGNKEICPYFNTSYCDAPGNLKHCFGKRFGIIDGSICWITPEGKERLNDIDEEVYGFKPETMRVIKD
jgi:hypothetical protein